MEMAFVFNSKKAIAANGGIGKNFTVNFSPTLSQDVNKYYTR